MTGTLSWLQYQTVKNLIITISFLCKVPHVTVNGPQKRSFPGQRVLVSKKAFYKIRGLHRQRWRPFILSAKGCVIRLLLGTLIRPSTERALYRTTSASKWNISVFGFCTASFNHLLLMTDLDHFQWLVNISTGFVQRPTYMYKAHIYLQGNPCYFSNKITLGI